MGRSKRLSLESTANGAMRFKSFGAAESSAPMPPAIISRIPSSAPRWDPRKLAVCVRFAGIAFAPPKILLGSARLDTEA